MDLRIKYLTIDLLLLVLITTFLSYFTSSYYTIFRYIITLYLFIKYCKEIKKAPFIYILLLAYSILLAISSYVNNNSVSWGISGFMHGIRLICLFSVLSGITAKRGIENVISSLLWILSLLTAVTDLLILFYPYVITSSTVYFVGDKFHVAYMHCLLLALLSIKYKYRNSKSILFLIISIVSICVLLKIKCTTGLLMVVFSLGIELLVRIFNRIKKSLCHISISAILLAIINFLIWGPLEILYSSWASFIIVDLLGKTQNMTGRFKLYWVIPNLIVNKPFIGYGFQTDIFRNLFGYGNAQNGLMQIVIEAGIIGAILYFGALFLAGHKGKRDIRSYPIYIYILSFVIGSISEMNLSTYFVFGIAILYAYGVATPAVQNIPNICNLADCNNYFGMVLKSN